MHNYKSYRSLIILWLGQSLSRFGSSLTPFALSLWAYSETGSAFAVSMLTVSVYVPYIIFSIPAGVVCERRNKKALILFADTAAAVCTLAVGLCHAAGSLTLGFVYMANCLNGLMQAFQAPASDVAVTLVTPDDKIQKAGGLRSLSNAVISLAGPAAATAVYTLWGLDAVIMADLLSYLAASASLLFLVRIPEEKKKEAEKESFSKSLREGAGFLRTHTGLVEIILFLGCINFIASIYNAALPALILEKADETVLAAIHSAAGAAMLLPGIAAAMLSAPRRRVRVIVISLFISMSSENFVLAFSSTPAMWLAGAFAGWLCIPVMNANLDALMRLAVPQEMQARVYSIRNMMQFGSIPAGYAAGGLLVDKVFEPFMLHTESSVLHTLFGSGKGSGAAMLFAAIGFCGVAVCIIFSSLKAMRELDN